MNGHLLLIFLYWMHHLEVKTKSFTNSGPAEDTEAHKASYKCYGYRQAVTNNCSASIDPSE